MVLAVLRQAPDASPASVRIRLYKREPFESVTGLLTWKDSQPRRQLFLLRLVNNRPKLVQTLPPDAE